jgi:uncharacterized protein YlzI (FlbEa/FlbD family)
MKIIELTGQDGRPLYLNAEFIVSFFSISEKSRLEYKGSYVNDISGGDSFEVRETPEQIIKLIKTL